MKQPQQQSRFSVYTPVERDGHRTFWARVGTAFTNKDGSLNVYLDALPVNGKLNIREADIPSEPGSPASA